MTFGHRLHPDSLPDTGNSRIPDAFRTVYLFATRLRSAICRVPYLHNKFIVSFSSQSSRNIEWKRSKSSGVLSHLNVIDPNISFPVYSTEVQHHFFTFPGSGYCESTLIPEFFVGADFLTNTRKAGLYGKRNQNLTFVSWRSSPFLGDGIIPQTIQVLPLSPFHHRTWILGQYIFRIHLLSPLCLDFVSCRFPLCKSGSSYRRCQNCN